MSSVEMGGLFGEIVGTKGLRTPLLVPPSLQPASTPVTWSWDLGGAWSTTTCTEAESTQHRWIPGGGGN